MALTPAQQAYYDDLMGRSGQGSPAEIYDYVSGLRDAQAEAALAALRPQAAAPAPVEPEPAPAAVSDEQIRSYVDDLIRQNTAAVYAPEVDPTDWAAVHQGMYDAAQRYGVTPEQVDTAMRYAPGTSAEWIEQNITNPRQPQQPLSEMEELAQRYGLSVDELNYLGMTPNLLRQGDPDEMRDYLQRRVAGLKQVAAANPTFADYGYNAAGEFTGTGRTQLEDLEAQRQRIAAEPQDIYTPAGRALLEEQARREATGAPQPNPGGVGGVGTVAPGATNPGGVGGVGTTTYTPTVTAPVANPGGAGGVGTAAPVNLGYTPTAGTVAPPAPPSVFTPPAPAALNAGWTQAPGAAPELQPLFAPSPYASLGSRTTQPAAQVQSFQDLLALYGLTPPRG